jgi:hypothetical protein
MKRILALDGGGIRGVFTLKILLRMQALLREQTGNPALVLADHFDLFAGTSTGAIIASGLCWGMAVEDILAMYKQFAQTMFTPVPWRRPIRKLLIARYEAKPLSEMLRRYFSEDGEGREPALLGSPRLRKSLLVVLRNHSTGSAWPLTNNREALFNDPSRADSNLNIPLWKIVRASTAAPVYFDPERIVLDGRTHVFVDGGITPYNNPALIAAQTAILPGYRMRWEAGADQLRLVSVGTLRLSSELPGSPGTLWLGHHARKIPMALMDGVAWQQDYLCRCLGACLFGEPLDAEIGDLVGAPLPGTPWFSYVRYNKSYKATQMVDLLREHPEMARLDAVAALPILETIGHAYAHEHVQLQHLV